MREFYYPSLTTDINVWLGSNITSYAGNIVHHAFIDEINKAGIKQFALQPTFVDESTYTNFASIANEVAISFDQMNENDIKRLVLEKLSKFKVLYYIAYYSPPIINYVDKSQLYITLPKLIFKGVMK